MPGKLFAFCFISEGGEEEGGRCATGANDVEKFGKKREREMQRGSSERGRTREKKPSAHPSAPSRARGSRIVRRYTLLPPLSPVSRTRRRFANPRRVFCLIFREAAPVHPRDRERERKRRGCIRGIAISTFPRYLAQCPHTGLPQLQPARAHSCCIPSFSPFLPSLALLFARPYFRTREFILHITPRRWHSALRRATRGR